LRGAALKAILHNMNEFDFIAEMLAEGVREGCFPAGVAAVGVGDKILATYAAGDADLGTRFDMASLTKVLSPTMLALGALEDGTLTLHDPLSLFFDTPADKANITVKQLMTHTGGFAPTFLLETETDDPADAAACILRHPLQYRPGDMACYSCLGYILLGKVLEAVYTAPLDTLARTRVFMPLGMGRTEYNPSGTNIAPTEVDPQTGIACCGGVHDENARFLGGVSGNAGVFSDVGDMLRFASMLATGGGGFLSPATLRKAIHNYTQGQAVHRGLGFHLAGTPENYMGDLFPNTAFGHTGFTGTSLAVDPETGLFAVLLTNRVHPSRANERLFRFRRRFHNKVYASFTRHME